MTKWCGDLWGLVEVMVRRCSALLVLGLGEDEGLWVGIFGEHSEHSEQLGALGFFEGGDFGSTRSNSEHSDFEDGDFLGLFLIGSVGFSGLGHLFSDAALL